MPKVTITYLYEKSIEIDVVDTEVPAIEQAFKQNPEAFPDLCKLDTVCTGMYVEDCTGDVIWNSR